MNPLRRGLGWREDNPDVVADELVGRHVSKLLGEEPGAIGNVVDYSKFLDKIPDQGSTNSCVGQAFATALYLTAKLHGMPIPRPSAKAIYDFARLEDQKYVELFDDGSRPLAAVACITDKGLVDEEQWPILIHPDGMTNINVRPTLDVYADSLEATLGGHYRISQGMGASGLVRQALMRKYCPVFAMPVDEQFLRWHDDKVYEGRVGPLLGWHMQAICGYGDGFVLVAGSWGRAFADAGVVALSNSYFDSGECKDIIVPTVVPMLKEDNHVPSP